MHQHTRTPTTAKHAKYTNSTVERNSSIVDNTTANETKTNRNSHFVIRSQSNGFKKLKLDPTKLKKKNKKLNMGNGYHWIGEEKSREFEAKEVEGAVSLVSSGSVARVSVRVAWAMAVAWIAIGRGLMDI